MSLSGNLSFVPIDEVLRLLSRSKQQGSVDVTGNGLRGRIFIGKGGIDLATTWNEDDLYNHLVNSGLAEEQALRRVTTGETTLAAIADSNQPIIDLLREMTVESLYQMGRRGEDFIVREGATTPYASPKSFELEHLVQDAEAREREWNNVNEHIPSLTGAMGFRRDLGERDEVTVKVDDWKVLSEIGAGASVAQIAERLGTTDFWTAKVASRLIQHDLIEVRDETDEATPETTETYETPVADNWDTRDEEPAADHYGYQPQAQEAEEADETEEPSETYEQGDVFSAQDESEEDVDPDESWWTEPEAEDSDDESADDGDTEEVPEVVGEGLSEMPAADDEDHDVEEDTEAFLEKVFSELESSEPEVDEGHGLLRRRRMGSLRDFSSDS